MEKLDENKDKEELHTNNNINININHRNKKSEAIRHSLLSFISFEDRRESEDAPDEQEMGNRSYQVVVNRFFYTTPTQSILNKFCDNSINDYIFHTKIFLEYDDENAFIFVFKNSLVFTHLFDENKDTLVDNPIIYIIKFQQVKIYFLFYLDLFL
jgi:hypothetical protein